MLHVSDQAVELGGATYAPNGGPVGSIYQPTNFFPRNPRGDAIAGGRGSVPGPSNFAGVQHPPRVWNTRADFGNALAFFNQK